MKPNMLIKRCALLVYAVALTTIGCKFEEIVEPATATTGETITITLVMLAEDAEEGTEHPGLICVLAPADWSYVSGEYDAGLVGSGAMVENTSWADSAEACNPEPEGYRWFGFVSEAGYLHAADDLAEVTLQFNVGQTAGDYNLRYIATKASSGLLCTDWAFWNADSISANTITVSAPAGISERRVAGTPETFGLEQNFPNPFNPATKIVYAVPELADVRLIVYDLTGKEVAVLAEGLKFAGQYEVTFASGQLPTGMYFYRLTAGSFTETRKMLFIK